MFKFFEVNILWIIFNRFTEIHFKVVGFASDENNSEGYLVDSKHTSLYQVKALKNKTC